MAYNAVVTVTREGETTVIHISETDAANGDEATITGVPSTGEILRQTCVLTAGTGTTVDPVLATSAGGTGAAIVVSNDVAAATVDTAYPVVAYTGGAGTLYHQSKVDAGADNSITTVYLVSAGW
jgi:hypothetical protein